MGVKILFDSQLSYLIDAIDAVSLYMQETFYSFFEFLFDNRSFPLMSFLFYLALLPSLVGIVFDILFSFMMSIRLKRIFIFLPWRTSHWDLLRSSVSHRFIPSERNYSVRYSSISKFGRGVLIKMGIIKPKEKKHLVVTSDGSVRVVKTTGAKGHNVTSSELRSHLDKYSELTASDFKRAEHLHQQSLSKERREINLKSHRYMSRKKTKIDIEADDID